MFKLTTGVKVVATGVKVSNLTSIHTIQYNLFTRMNILTKKAQPKYWPSILYYILHITVNKLDKIKMQKLYSMCFLCSVVSKALKSCFFFIYLYCIKF